MAKPAGFEWDDAKERDNQRKHGFAFAEAASLFAATEGIEDIDDRFDYGEERLIAFGPVAHHLSAESQCRRSPKIPRSARPLRPTGRGLGQ
ncbi:MAG: BrnT family toxin [Terricaulis sp.]